MLHGHNKGFQGTCDGISLKFVILFGIMASNTWTIEKTAELIDLYQEKPCLYNTKHKNYFNRDHRAKALSEISEVIGLEGKKRVDHVAWVDIWCFGTY